MASALHLASHPGELEGGDDTLNGGHRGWQQLAREMARRLICGGGGGDWLGFANLVIWVVGNGSRIKSLQIQGLHVWDLQDLKAI